MDAESVIEAWPLCPECQRARVTVCPICGTAGSDFPRADENYFAGGEPEVHQLETRAGEPTEENSAAGAFQAGEQGEQEMAEPSVPREARLAIICTTCDEPWLARFYRRCEWCGHDFGAGIAVEPAPAKYEPLEPINPRVVALIGLMLAALGLVLGWFWYITRR